MSSFKKGPKKVTAVVTGATHKAQDRYEDREVDGIKYTLFVPKQNCTYQMERGFNKKIIKIAEQKGYAKNRDEIDVWIRAIQKVYDEHKSEIEGQDKYGEFHKKKVYFYNPNYGNRGHCMYLAVQRKNKPEKVKWPSDLEELSESDNDGIIELNPDQFSSEVESLGHSSSSGELLSDSDIESEDEHVGPLVGYNKDTPTERFITKSGKVVYVNANNEKDKRLYNKDGEYIGKLNDDGTIESAEDAIKRVNEEANKKGGRKKKRRTKKKRNRRRTKKRRKRRRRKTRK